MSSQSVVISTFYCNSFKTHLFLDAKLTRVIWNQPSNQQYEDQFLSSMFETVWKCWICISRTFFLSVLLILIMISRINPWKTTRIQIQVIGIVSLEFQSSIFRDHFQNESHKFNACILPNKRFQRTTKLIVACKCIVRFLQNWIWVNLRYFVAFLLL